AVKSRARIVGDVAGCHRDRFDPALATRLRHVDRVLRENYGVIVSKRDRLAAETFRCERDLLRRRGVGKLVPFACFGDVPVLTKPATKIASSCTEREHARPRQKMVQRFLFDWINTKAATPTIGGQHHLIAQPLPDETKSALSFV